MAYTLEDHLRRSHRRRERADAWKMRHVATYYGMLLGRARGALRALWAHRG